MAGEYLADALGVAAERLLELRLIREIRVPNPSAGTDWNISVPGGTIWELLSVESLFNTSAVVSNRSPMLQVLNQDNGIVMRLPGAAVVTAGSGARVFWGMGLGAVGSVGTQSALLPTPSVTIPSSWTLGSITGSLDVGDQYTLVTLMVRQWSEIDVVQEAMVIDAQLSALTEREVTGR